MMPDRALWPGFWQVLDALDYRLTLTQFRILDALCGEGRQINADEVAARKLGETAGYGLPQPPVGPRQSANG